MIVTRSLRTRGYELDHEGLIAPVALLRYLEHLRWEALSADELPSLFQGGRSVVIVSQRLRLLKDLSMGQDLRAQLWIGAVGRTSLTFHHLLHRGEELTAAASVTAVHLNGEGRPTPLPGEIRSWVREEVIPDLPPPLEGEPPPGAWIWPVEVRPSDTDLLRHVNHASYGAYVEDARYWGARRGAYGEDPRARARLRGISLVYRQQALAGEALDVVTWPQEGAFAFAIRRRGEEGALCRVRVEVAP